MRKKLYIASIIFLLCLGPAIYLYSLRVNPPDIRNASFSYTGRCINITAEVEHYGKQNRNMYVLSMEDGREFWIDGLFSEEGNFDFSHFYNTALGNTLTLRYIDHNLNGGSFAKEVVEVQNADEVFLAMDTVARTFRNTQILVWTTYFVVLAIHILAMVINYLTARRQRKLTAHRQQTKAKRREWLDTHPEEKGAPPSARRKKNCGRE